MTNWFLFRPSLTSFFFITNNSLLPKIYCKIIMKMLRIYYEIIMKMLGMYNCSKNYGGAYKDLAAAHKKMDNVGP